MKRFRHYDKDLAIVLSCFGSVVEQQKYLDLAKKVEESFSDAKVFVAFQSRMVLKKLAKNSKEYKNLTQTLADVDMLGYKRVVVASINLFPACEHQHIKRIVDGFNSFSESYIKCTDAILNKTKYTTKALLEIDKKFKSLESANLFIIHGSPKLETIGLGAIEYAGGFLSRINKNNLFCSLEGAYPFFSMQEAIIDELKQKGLRKVNLIPLLLVSGNHYEKDAVEIKEILEKAGFQIELASNGSEKYALIEESYIVDIILDEIKEQITKTNVSG